jgi:hypothetical protein
MAPGEEVARRLLTKVKHNLPGSLPTRPAGHLGH